ncbi:hypothetical protein BZG25_14630 [Salinivibrio sp. ML198]|uniref:DUF2931 family protein n=1 Tax=Salinivibrio sp. ML198 TaxID=1909458 RepID=UPI0009894592|nr:DUF2931 family protein [Salinivibrio sp. ML198]OOE77966.1 hypothetical protein BZG25_14630 [Salinivibrio sp. ML198]
MISHKTTIQVIFLSLSISMLTGCKENEPLPGDPWQVSVVTPSFYPIKITQAYGVNEEQDWKMPIHGLSQSMRKSRIDYVRTVFPDYDGFGFPLSSLTAVNGRQVGSANKHLPDSIYIYWTSLINMRFFVTKYDLPQKVKEIMAKGVSFERYDGSLGYCFRNEFFFGMLPNGKAKVWLMGCDQLIYLAELEPAREKDRDQNGTTADVYRRGSKPEKAKQRGIDAGVSTVPIPWEKVGKVYSTDTVELLSEQ